MLSFALVSVAAAWGYSFDGHVWPDDALPVQLHLSDAAAGVSEHLAAAADAWNEELCSTAAGPRLEIAPGYVENLPLAEDGLSRVSVDDPGDEFATGVLAAASVYVSDVLVKEIDGQHLYAATEADLVFNDGVAFASDAAIEAGICGEDYSLQAVATHHLGHALGLGHSCEADELCLDQDWLEATMYWATSPCDTSGSTIESYDRDVLTALYSESPERSVVAACVGGEGAAEGACEGAVPLEVSCSVAYEGWEVSGLSWDFGAWGSEEGAEASRVITRAGVWEISLYGEYSFSDCGDAVSYRGSIPAATCYAWDDEVDTGVSGGEGCGCRQGRSAPGWGVLLLVLVGLRRADRTSRTARAWRTARTCRTCRTTGTGGLVGPRNAREQEIAGHSAHRWRF